MRVPSTRCWATALWPCLGPRLPTRITPPGLHAAPAMQYSPRLCRGGAPHLWCGHRAALGLNSGEVVVRTIYNDLHMDYPRGADDAPRGPHGAGGASDTILHVCDRAAGRRVGAAQGLGAHAHQGPSSAQWRCGSHQASGLRRRLQTARARAPPLCGAADGAGCPVHSAGAVPGRGTARWWRW